MIQENTQFRTMRQVRRRPRFVSAADVKAKKVRRPLNTTSLPDYWDMTQIPQTGFSRIPLPHTSQEFKNIEALFCETMQGFKIFSIERIQNKFLWEVFMWQKDLMKNKNSGHDVTERHLFHGTSTRHLNAICHDNFDWRICGAHGTSYGKGSYFAQDASYSHKYTSDSLVKSMFIARVLVGSYIEGASHYVRPPSKDGGNTNFYDSCVDDVKNPSIFVVFEKHQIYPEYLLQYKGPINVQINGTSSSVQHQNQKISSVPASKRATQSHQSGTVLPQSNKPASHHSSSSQVRAALRPDQNHKTNSQFDNTIKRSKSLPDLKSMSKSRKSGPCAIM